MRFIPADDVAVTIPRRALDVIFDECDRYDADETGGRILGTYEKRGPGLAISVGGIIEPGPGARRTATYLQQDGLYQERVFREVEERVPEIEHLGNWHTHHVNMLRHLSGGDIETYGRIVEHANHNTDFFYALLVTERLRGPERYAFKNYVFRRGDRGVYEIPAGAVTIVDRPLVWPSEAGGRPTAPAPASHTEEDPLNKKELIYDREVVSDFFPKVKTYKSKELGIYWRGPIPLVDGSDVEAVVLTDETRRSTQHTVTLRDPPATLARTAKRLEKESFPSCRAALIAVERLCNAELYDAKSGVRKRRRWIF